MYWQTGDKTGSVHMAHCSCADNKGRACIWDTQKTLDTYGTGSTTVGSESGNLDNPSALPCDLVGRNAML